MTSTSIGYEPSILGVDLTQEIDPALADFLPDDDAPAADNDEADVDLDL